MATNDLAKSRFDNLERAEETPMKRKNVMVNVCVSFKIKSSFYSGLQNFMMFRKSIEQILSISIWQIN